MTTETAARTASKYLSFELVHDTGKTKVYEISSKGHGFLLGTVKWYGRWRQYVIEPEPDTGWNKECLRDVALFLDTLMAERKAPAS